MNQSSLTASHLTSVDGPWGNDTLSYTCEELDRPLSRSVNGEVFESLSYDLAGNRASRQSGQAVTQDTHNALNQLLTRSGGGPVRVAGRVSANGVSR